MTSSLHHAAPVLDEWSLRREGIVLSPAAGDPLEVEGVLNPAATLGPDGRLHLYVRVVAAGNFSRIRHVVGTRTAAGWVMERHCVALEPREPYELRREGGGCEDARVTRCEALGVWVMTYTGYGDIARICLAVSDDLETWQRLGPVEFAHELDVDLNVYWNKDAVLLPEPVAGPDGHQRLAFLHRPMWNGAARPSSSTHERDSIWISYTRPVDEVIGVGPAGLLGWTDHHEVATPHYDWEAMKVGAGAPPVLVPEGWLLLHHGVSHAANDHDGGNHVEYSPGLILLERNNPARVLARTSRPLLVPKLAEEREGTVPNVIFPTGIVPDGNDYLVFYGAADQYIGMARLKRSQSSAN